MRLSTTTELFPEHRNTRQMTPMLEAVDLCYNAGFRVLDLNLCGADKNMAHDLAADDWEARFDAIGNRGAQLGISFSQAHLPFNPRLYRPDLPPYSEEYRAWYREVVRRGIIVSGRLGVKWLVNHAQTATAQAELETEENIRVNREFFGWQIELARQVGAGIAIENMAEFNHNNTKRRFTALVEEQIAIIDAINDPACGGCWDFGHAEMVYRDQTVPLRKLGHRLKATHVQEATRNADAHLIPFVRGTTPWEKIMPLLKEMKYEGDFTYETHSFMERVPDALRPAAARFAYEVGMYCLSLYEQA